MNVRASALSALLLIAFGVSGCRAGRDHPILNVIPRDVDAPSTSEHAGITAEAARHRLRVYWNGPSYADEVDEQIGLVDRAIETRSYGLIVSPNNPYALNAGLAKALADHIPVVILGAAIPLRQQPGLAFVLSDLSRPTDSAASYLAQRLPSDSEVMIMGLNELSPGNADEAKLFVAAIRRRAPGFDLVQEEHAPFSLGQTEQSVERVLRTHPRLHAVFALDPRSTTGVLAAVTNLGLAGKVHIIGCDPTLNVLYLLRKGQIDALIVQNMPRLGEVSVDQVIALREGRSVPSRVTVPGLLVTAGNVDEPEIQKSLRMDWKSPS